MVSKNYFNKITLYIFEQMYKVIFTKVLVKSCFENIFGNSEKALSSFFEIKFKFQKDSILEGT